MKVIIAETERVESLGLVGLRKWIIPKNRLIKMKSYSIEEIKRTKKNYNIKIEVITFTIPKHELEAVLNAKEDK